jgi:hypothetical protein
MPDGTVAIRWAFELVCMMYIELEMKENTDF